MREERRHRLRLSNLVDGYNLCPVGTPLTRTEPPPTHPRAARVCVEVSRVSPERHSLLLRSTGPAPCACETAWFLFVCCFAPPPSVAVGVTYAVARNRISTVRYRDAKLHSAGWCALFFFSFFLYLLFRTSGYTDQPSHPPAATAGCRSTLTAAAPCVFCCKACSTPNMLSRTVLPCKRCNTPLADAARSRASWQKLKNG
jgi:hypothetical protein